MEHKDEWERQHGNILPDDDEAYDEDSFKF